MSCGRIRRELIEIVRFGEFGPGSAAHLDHLADCRGCRDEVGLDRALVAQLRRALAARIEAANPPTHAWHAILREAQRPEPALSVWSWWSSGLVGRLRTATAMAGTGLALVLALNMEVIPTGALVEQAPTAESEDVALQRVPRVPTGRTTLVALANLANDIGASARQRPDPEQALTGADARVTPPPSLGEGSEPAEEPGPVRLLIRSLQTPELDPAPGADDAPRSGGSTDSSAETVDMRPGEPS